MITENIQGAFACKVIWSSTDNFAALDADLYLSA